MMSKGFIFTTLASFSWAVAIILTRFLLHGGISVYALILWASLFALPYWLGILYRKRQEIRRLKRNDIAILLGMGLISGIGVDITEYFALKYSQATTYAFLIRTVMIFTFIFAYIFLREPLTKKKIILAGVLLLGAYFLTTNGQGLVFSLGAMFTLLEAALVALGNNVFGKIATNRMSADVSAAGTFLFAFVPIVVFSGLFGGFVIPHSLFFVLLLACIYIALSMLRFKAYGYASASYVTMIFSFTPVFVSVLAIPFLGESLTTMEMIGGILTILAGVGVEKLKI